MPFRLSPWTLHYKFSEKHTVLPLPFCQHHRYLLRFRFFLLSSPPEPTLFSVHPLPCCLRPWSLLYSQYTHCSAVYTPRNLLYSRYNPCPVAYTPGTYSFPGTTLVLLPIPFPVHLLSCCLHPRNLLCSRYNPLSCCLHPRNLLCSRYNLLSCCLHPRNLL